MKWYEKQKNTLHQKSEEREVHSTNSEPSLQSEQEEVQLDERIQSLGEAEHNEENVSLEPTVIAQGVIVNGNMETQGDLLIHGRVIGDVLCHANLMIYGEVEGSIQCKSAHFEHARIHGDVHCSQHLEVLDDTCIDGNIEATSLLHGGAIIGDAMVQEAIHCTSTSNLNGNISAKEIEVEKGAIINGTMMIAKQSS